jgi:serine/threonine protein kinase
MDEDVFCLGCMNEIVNLSTCPHCGWVTGTAPESALHLSPGSILQSKYLIGRVLGQGGFGITYLAWDLNLNLKLAVKEYLPQELAYRTGDHSEVNIYKRSLTDNFNYGLENFLEEARTLARFNEHPNIVSVKDFFKANGKAYLVMNHIEGVTLKGFLESREEPLSFEQAINIFMPVLEALKEVHAAGILHRDISPDNMLIDARGQIVLIDFGAARKAIGEKSRSMSVIMKAGYSPEEQYRSKGILGPWTDIYAVAASLYMTISGLVPPDSLDRLSEDDLKTPSSLGARIESHQEKALLKALSLYSSDRYQRIEDFQAALMTPIIVEGSETCEQGGQGPSGSSIAEAGSNNRERYRSTITDVPVDKSLEKDSLNKKSPYPLIAIAVFIIFVVAFGMILVFRDNSGEESAIVSTELIDSEIVSSEYIEPNPDEIPAIRGNSIGNIVNVGIAAQDGNLIFYRNTEEGGVIYRGEFNEDKDILISGDDAWNINAAKGWVYYSNRAENWNVYKVRYDGSDRTRLNDDDSGNLQLVGEWLYYRNDDDKGSIYRMRNDGSERTRLNREESFYINVTDEWIYYQNRHEDGHIYKRHISSGESVKINNDNSWYINVVGDRIYYSNADQGWNIYSVRLDGTDRIRLNNDDSGDLNVAGEWIYYRNDSDGSKLYKIRLDGRERSQLNQDQTYFASVFDEWIFYQNRSDNKRIYKIRLDGSDRQPVY